MADYIVEYEVRVIVKRAVDLEYRHEDYVCGEAKRDLERELMHVFRKLNADCDCEVMSAEVRESD